MGRGPDTRKSDRKYHHRFCDQKVSEADPKNKNFRHCFRIAAKQPPYKYERMATHRSKVMTKTNSEEERKIKRDECEKNRPK